MEAENDAARRLHHREDRSPSGAKADRYKRLYLDRDAALAESSSDEVALPGEVGGPVPMLDGAGAALAEMAAHRRHALVARRDQSDKACPAAVALDLGHLARERERHKDAAGRRFGDT